MKRTACLVFALVAGCSTASKQELAPVGSQGAALDDEAPLLKVHTHDGGVLVLGEWDLDDADRTVRGDGIEYDANRTEVARGSLTTSYDDVALLETNTPKRVTHSGLVVMGVVSGAALGGTIACAANPKACFGSCPTFYRPGDDRILAEGFSASIAASMEATDVDTLDGWVADGTAVQVEMRNEALETHVVRYVDLLAVPQPASGTVVRLGDAFAQIGEPVAPAVCRASHRNCRPEVSDVDALAYRSPADPDDLAAQETVELEFDRPAGPSAVVLRARNSLLNTFLFYHALALLGPDAGARLAALADAPPDDPRLERLRRFGELLADIDVAVRVRAGGRARWESVGKYREVGPLAWESAAIEIPADIVARLPPGALHVRLTMTQGYWKLDRVGVAPLGESVQPVRLHPSHVDGEVPAHDHETPLVTYPGDGYVFHYDVPAGPHVLFLETRGYYYEWMRQSWMADHDPREARRLLRSPRRALRRLAPRYKTLEPDAEEIFWNSRVR